MAQGQVPVLPQYGARDVLMLRSRVTPGATSGDHHQIQDPSKALAVKRGCRESGKQSAKAFQSHPTASFGRAATVAGTKRVRTASLVGMNGWYRCSMSLLLGWIVDEQIKDWS